MNTLPTNTNLTKQPDVIARYFLRRFALAQRKPNKPSVQFNNALADTIGVFVVFPIIGLVSFILILSHRWAPNTIAKWFGLSPQVGMIAIVILSMLGGYWVLHKRLKQYRDDRTTYLSFATDLDKRIVIWQKLIVFAICAMLVPFLSLLVTFGTQVITKAFD